MTNKSFTLNEENNVPKYKYMTSGEKLVAIINIVESIKSKYPNSDLNVIELLNIIGNLGCDLVELAA